MDDENIIQLKLILPILIELNIFYLISSQCDEDKIISHLPISNLKILSILTYLIISLIPYLNIFKFKFNCNRIYRNETFLNRYLQFQIPYLSNTFKLEFYTKRLSNKLINTINTFDKVINLTLNDKQIKKKQSFYRFPNACSLTLTTLEEGINISMCSKIILTGELLDTLKKSSQLSSIKINSNDLILIFNHNQLCSYLNKMIKQNKYIQICSMFI
ncbi:unnamed protein product [Rotaria sp. Silwood1]|nr:unnamed protein product [Rotaria sp. Silwood1]CAF3525268.1 unnamed protein product [Rotaria sp. Silwood1]CAF4735766.1 unnamed protein product [Rotaria sp. Silwood1]CAF4839099.1 unnamed protein product [Rotaria sp. Silwood1]